MSETGKAHPLVTLLILGSPIVTIIFGIANAWGYVALPQNIVLAFVTVLIGMCVLAGDITFIFMVVHNKLNYGRWLVLVND